MTNLEKWRYFLKDIESPDSFINWSYYSLVAAALQRRVWLQEDPYQLFPNLYLMLVGPPSTGKSMAVRPVKSVLEHPKMSQTINKNGLDMLVPRVPTCPDSITLEKLRLNLATSYLRTTTIKDGLFNIGKKYYHNSVAIIASEFGVLIKQNDGDFVNVLNDGYDSCSLTNETKTAGDDDIKNVCINILACTTPNFISNSAMINEGFLSRVILVYEAKPRQLISEIKDPTPDQRRAFDEIIDHIYKLSALCGKVTFSQEALNWFDTYYISGEFHGNRVNKELLLDHYYGRKKIHMKKLAMILHFSENFTKFEISKDTLKRALAILEEVEGRMHLGLRMNSGTNKYHTATTGILHKLEHTPEGIDSKELYWAFNTEVTLGEFGIIMQELRMLSKVRQIGEKWYFGKGEVKKRPGS